MTETNEERLEGLKWVSAARPLTREEAHWLIEQAERAHARFDAEELKPSARLVQERKYSALVASENDRMRDVLEFYADENKYERDYHGESIVEIDCGHRARKELGVLK